MSKTYFEEAKERWGDTAAWREFEKHSNSADEAADGLMKLFAKLGELKELPPKSDKAQTAIANIQRYITENYYKCTDEIFAGLGEMYAADEQFRENIDKAGGNGTAEFARDAIRIYCNKAI